MKTILAIDPGAKGGFAWTVMGRAHAVKMPETDTDIVNKIRDIIEFAREGGGEIEVWMEQVSGFAGGSGHPGSAMFNFGDGVGIIKGALLYARVRTLYVSPQRWQKWFNIGTRGAMVKAVAGAIVTKEEKKRIDTANRKMKQEWKNKLKDQAQRRFPHLIVTLGMADALLILEYAKAQP